MEGDAQTGGREHGEVVGAVPYGDCLGDVDVLHLGDQAQKLGLALAVDNLADVAPGQFAVLDLQFVGVYVVEAEAAAQVFTEEGEPSGEDGGLEAGALEDLHHAVHSLGDGKRLGDFFHDIDIQPFEGRHARGSLSRRAWRFR